METRISTKGQIVLPLPVRRKLGLQAGDPLQVKVDEAGFIILTPTKKRTFKPQIITDTVTGFPVLTAGPDAPKLTSEQVAEILADFP